MRIAVVHSFYSASLPSGENRVVVDQVDALRRAGHEVLLVAQVTDELSRHRTYALRAAWRVATGLGTNPLSVLRDFAPDVVQVHNLFPNFGTMWVRDWNGPVLLTIHNYRSVCANGMLFRDGELCFECPDHSAMRGVMHGCYRGSSVATIPVALGLHRRGRDLLHAVTQVITTSEASDELIRRLTGLNSTRVIPNFGSGTVVTPRPAAVRTGWVAMGRISAEKGFGRLIQDWPRDAELTLIGDGPDASSIDLQAARDARLNRLTAMPIDDLRERLAYFKGLVFPSQWPEVAPQVVVEAMRVGLPVIAREGNSVAETVRQCGAGATYRDAKSLADALVAVNSNLEALSIVATETFRREWTEAAWLRRIENAYVAAINAHGR